MINVVEVGLNSGPVVLEVEPNFTLDLKQTNLSNTIKVLVQTSGLDMKPDQPAIAVHHTMTYKVQTHLFSLSHTNLPAIRLSTDGRIIHPQNYTQNQLVFPPS